LEFPHNSSNPKKSIFISTGEISGDFYAGEIIKHLQKRRNLEVFVLGGENAARTGANLIYDTTTIATVGIWEIFSTFRQWKRVWDRSVDLIRTIRPAVVMIIDNPGFNLRLARFCHRFDIPVISFIPPQVWVWNRRRATFLSHYADWILTIFPWEEHYFQGGKAKVKWVGHPVLSKIPDLSFFDTGEENHRIVLLPGSRKREIDEFLKVISRVLVIFREHHPQFTYTLVLASEKYLDLVENQLAGIPVIIEKRENLYQALQGSSLSISCSGTITLEVALAGIPQIIVYRLSPFTYLLARLFLRKRYVGLPNIIMEQQVCPELIQNDFHPAKIIKEMENLFVNSQKSKQMQQVAWQIREKLFQGDAYSQIIEVIENYL